MIEKPNKERSFLKTLGKIGEILLQEVLIKVGSSLIKRIGGKKTLPSILFLFLSVCLFAQYPATGNKQRLGYQTTGDGLVYRGRASDTTALKPSTINNAYHLFDTVNNVLFSYIKTKGGWKFNNSDTVIINNTIDTTSLSSRINLKVNISDTASMLLKYLRKADTSLLNLNTRFAAKLNLLDTASMLTNYLRSGVAASTYLTQSSAASTYLPLTGGTLTGALNGTTGTFTGLNVINSSTEGVLTLQGYDNNTPTRIQFKTTGNVRREIVLPTSDSNLEFRTSTIGGTQGGYSFYTRRNSNEEQLAFNIDFNRDIQMYGGLSVSGATTLSNLAGSGTRMVTASSTGLLSSQTIPSGTLVGADTVSLSNRINTKVGLLGNETINGVKTFSASITSGGLTLTSTTSGTNRLLGLNTIGGAVGQITVGSGLNLTGDNLTNTGVTSVGITAPSLFTVSNSPITTTGNLALTYSGTALPIANGGTNATSASGARNNLDVDYVFFATTAGTAVSLTSNRVFIVNTGSFSTTTLDLTPATSGRMYMVKNLASGTVVSGASNVIPLNGGSPSTPILSAGNVTPQWVTLVADGTNWHIIQKN
jgi:hypothetical protein